MEEMIVIIQWKSKFGISSEEIVSDVIFVFSASSLEVSSTNQFPLTSQEPVEL